MTAKAFLPLQSCSLGLPAASNNAKERGGAQAQKRNAVFAGNSRSGGAGADRQADRRFCAAAT
jgi:hypothetical protein